MSIKNQYINNDKMLKWYCPKRSKNKHCLLAHIIVATDPNNKTDSHAVLENNKMVKMDKYKRSTLYGKSKMN